MKPRHYFKLRKVACPKCSGVMEIIVSGMTIGGNSDNPDSEVIVSWNCYNCKLRRLYNPLKQGYLIKQRSELKVNKKLWA